MGQNSLAYRVLKAKYFPKIDFVNASLGNNPSFTWKSLMEGRRVIEMGSKWRISNDYLVDAWEHKWINKPPSFKPERGTVQQRSQLQVASLINYEHRLWDEDVVNAYFTSEDAKLILQIP